MKRAICIVVLVALWQPVGAGQVVDLKRLAKNGGRVDWYKGTAHDLIAYDAVSGLVSRNTEVVTMTPSGSDKVCVTCEAAIPKGFVGQPAWHPDGEHLVVQAENLNSNHTLFEHMTWGINNDVWIVKRDGTGSELVYQSPPTHGVLHPHFNADGTQIVFAERIATGESNPALIGISPGGENPWDGWRLHLADFDIRGTGLAKLSNHRTLLPDWEGFFEPHGFTAGGSIVFSHTPDGMPYVDDIYVFSPYWNTVQRITDSPSTWEEHGRLSPSGNTFAFVSSLVDPTWQFPESRANSLKTELFALDFASGDVTRLTFANTPTSEGRRVVTDFSWSKTGTEIAFQIWFFDTDEMLTSAEVWVMSFQDPL